MKRVFLPLLAVLGMAGSAQANVEYQCQDYQGVLTYVTLFDEENVVEALFFEESTGQERRELLQPAVSGSGFRYANPNVEFYGQGSQDGFLVAGGVTLTCWVINVTEPGGSQQGGGVAYDGMPAISWGGNLRAGPGTNFAGAGSLPERAPITIVQDSGVYFNGYSWFLVRTQWGQQAYHWGGIMCVPGQQVQGIYGNC